MQENMTADRTMSNEMIANGEKVDKELLDYAYNLLSHARDMDESLNLLLEKIGKRFGVNLAIVFVQDVNRRQMAMTNSWTNLSRAYGRDVMPYIWREFEQEPVGGFAERKDCCQVSKIAAIKFEISNGTPGLIVIGAVKKVDEWTERERGTLGELSRIVGVFVSLRNRANEDRELIHELCRRERLTGLYDIDTFKAKVEKVMQVKADGYCYAAAMIDINNFAYINENFGTEVGNKILRELAELLSNIDPKIKFASRMYSDFFAAFMDGPTKEEVLAVLKKVTRAFEERLSKKYSMGRLNLSAGLCFINAPDEYEVVMENANIARKYAKERGISRGVAFEHHMRHKRDELVEVSTKFPGALINDEFEVYLQPKFLLNDWKVYGAEALVRWIKTDGTAGSPARFVPSLEVTGQIVELDFLIFEKVLSVMKGWMEQKLPLVTVSINFSRRHFEQGGPEFVKRVKKLAEQYGIPPEYIEIEITESTVVDNIDVIRKNMEDLQKNGFRIAIDDFGTGHSSLNVLLEIPANVIKMDKTFTDKLHMEKQRHFVAKMGMLIKALEQEVVFEGIETEEQLEHLKNSGFQYGQGYLFGKPVTVEEFEKSFLKLQNGNF